MEFTAIKQEVKASILDVAKWFLSQSNMTHKKVQKLCYYAQAYSLVFLNADICKDCDFEAWVHGPVNRTLWNILKDYGWEDIELKSIDSNYFDSLFSTEQKNVLKEVWNAYGEFTSDELEALTHSETPWLEKRKNLSIYENCSEVISKKTMRDFYKNNINE